MRKIETLYNFESDEPFSVGGLLGYTIENPEGCFDFDHLIGASVMVNSRRFRVAGVECFVHAPPWKKGERINILLADYQSSPSRCAITKGAR